MLRKLPIIAVFGQGSPINPDRRDLARSVGALIAGLGAHLLTGGGYGVMEAAAEGFVGVPGRPGFSIGIVPRFQDGAFDEPNRDIDGRSYPNSYVELPIFTPLPPRVEDWRKVPARNHVNVLTADAIVSLPGNAGTRNELDMAVEYRGERARPAGRRRTILLGPAEEFTPEHRAAFIHADTLDEAERHLRDVLASRGVTN